MPASAVRSAETSRYGASIALATVAPTAGLGIALLALSCRFEPLPGARAGAGRTVREGM